MSLAKVLKHKRDAEERLRTNSPTTIFLGGVPDTPEEESGGFVDVSGFATKPELATKADADHTHGIVDLTDVSIDYTDNAGKVLKVNDLEDGMELGDAGGVIEQATSSTLGGIKAETKTTESAEIKIDATTGKLYGPASGEATNGIPTGGTTEQILSKIDGTDYNTHWVDKPTNAESLLTKVINIADFTGKDGYILAYDEVNGEFYLKADEEGGGGGNSGFGEWGFHLIPITISTIDIA